MRFVLPLTLLYLASFMTPVAAKSDSDEPLESMLVATKESPPFAFRNAEGEWSGISIELWERLADVLDLPAPTYREMPLADMFDGLERREFGAAVAAISVTPERVRRVDFTHPYHNTGLGVAVSASRRGGWLASAAGQLMTWTALTVLAATVLWLVAVGAVFWLLERRRNPLFRDAGARKGLSLGFWWATTILLGNKSVLPVSPISRFMVIGGMVTSILLMVTFVGAIASFLTVSQLERMIHQPEDLRHVRVAAIPDTTSMDFLRRLRVNYEDVSNVPAGLDEVARGKVDAMVHDAPVLKHLANTDYVNRVEVLPVIFGRQEYAIALPRDSRLRQPLNEALLRVTRERWWDDLLYRYLGSADR